MKYREKIYLLIKIIFFFQHLKTSKHHLMTETPCTRNREMSIMDIYMKVRKCISVNFYLPECMRPFVPILEAKCWWLRVKGYNTIHHYIITSSILKSAAFKTGSSSRSVWYAKAND